MINEEKKEILLKDDKRANSECTEEKSEFKKEQKNKKMVLYLKCFDPATNTYTVKTVVRQKDLPSISSLNDLNNY